MQLESTVIAGGQFLVSLVLAIIGICRINRMFWSRPTFALAYFAITVGAIAHLVSSIYPPTASPWHPLLLLGGVTLLLVDTRRRWREGPPADVQGRKS
jgi:hypothetical protein